MATWHGQLRVHLILKHVLPLPRLSHNTTTLIPLISFLQETRGFATSTRNNHFFFFFVKLLRCFHEIFTPLFPSQIYHSSTLSNSLTFIHINVIYLPLKSFFGKKPDFPLLQSSSFYELSYYLTPINSYASHFNRMKLLKSFISRK